MNMEKSTFSYSPTSPNHLWIVFRSFLTCPTSHRYTRLFRNIYHVGYFFHTLLIPIDIEEFLLLGPYSLRRAFFSWVDVPLSLQLFHWERATVVCIKPQQRKKFRF